MGSLLLWWPMRLFLVFGLALCFVAIVVDCKRAQLMKKLKDKVTRCSSLSSADADRLPEACATCNESEYCFWNEYAQPVDARQCLSKDDHLARMITLVSAANVADRDYQTHVGFSRYNFWPLAADFKAVVTNDPDKWEGFTPLDKDSYATIVRAALESPNCDRANAYQASVKFPPEALGIRDWHETAGFLTDVKGGWLTGFLTAEESQQNLFRIVTKRTPDQVRQEGFDPWQHHRDEVNVGTEAGDQLRLFKWKKQEEDGTESTSVDFYFTFAFPWDRNWFADLPDPTVDAPEEDDPPVPKLLLSKSLTNLGWIPKTGQTKYLYIVEFPEGARFANDQRRVHPAKEIAFADAVGCEAVKYAFEITGSDNFKDVTVEQVVLPACQ